MNTETLPNDTPTTALSARQEAVAVGVAAGLTLAAAARKSKVGVPTAKTWSATLPSFRRRIAELRSEMTAQATGRLAYEMACAAETLGKLARKGVSETVRLGAARAVLELGVKLRESVELEQRITELEQRQEQQGSRDGR